MPLPLNITWFQADQGAVNFEFRSTNMRPISVQLVNCHQEILDRPGPSSLETLIGTTPANYLLKRSTWIQERLLNLYVTAVRGGICNQGRFYGAFQQATLVHEMDGVRLDGEVVYINFGITHVNYRIGLLYTPHLIVDTPVSDAEVERMNLPTQVLPRQSKRDTYDTPVVAPPRRSRYDRPPVI